METDRKQHFCGVAMTQNEIIEMARQAGIGWGEGIGGMTDFLESFSKLVATKEREACAKVCETAREAIWEYHEEHLKAAACNVCTNIAQAIRARGQA